MQGKYISVLLFCIVFCILIAPVSAEQYCAFINITQGPQGIQGTQGIPGLNNLTPNMTAGQPGTPGLNNMTAGPKGDTGDAGNAATIMVNKTFTGDPGTNAIITNIGSSSAANFDFTIPIGATGSTGSTGAMNQTANMTAGPQGTPGIMNQTPNQTVGATGAPGPNNDAWYIWVNATRAFTGSLQMGNNQITSLITGLTGDSAVNRTFVNAVNDTIRNNVSINFAPIVSGKVPTVNLGGAGADATKYLRGDQSWQVPAGGSGNGYTLMVQGLSIASPADSAVYVFGAGPKIPTTTTLGLNKVYYPKAGTIKSAEIFGYATTAGSAEAWPCYLVNSTHSGTSILIQNITVSATTRRWTNQSMNIPAPYNDYFEVRCNSPAWGTNPVALVWSGTVYLE